MNEKEQQVIELLTEEACDICMCDKYGCGADHSMIKIVAKDITALFQQQHKDTRSRREKQLDEAFERMGVKPRVYHFTKEVCTFNAVTVALAKRWRYGVTNDIVKNCIEAAHDGIENKATNTITILKQAGIHGASVCAKSDPFSKRYGRNKAKGRLLQHLLKEEKK